MTDKGYQLADFPGRLDAWRAFLHLDVSTLVKRAGVGRRTIGSWSTQRASPTLPSMRVAQTVIASMGITAGEFFGPTPFEVWKAGR